MNSWLICRMVWIHPIGERGTRLSGGQRQRVAIARALYRDIEVLVLDEATSALDSKSEIAIQKAIQNLAGQLTVIVIAHRLETVEDCDKVIWLEKGRVREAGPALDVLTSLQDVDERKRINARGHGLAYV